MREIILADNAGFCFGVQRAVSEAFSIGENNKKVYTFGELIHNKDVVKKLEENNIYKIDESDLINVKKDNPILIRSHGLGEDKIKELEEVSNKVVNLTCPYVSNIHKIVKEYSGKGYKIVILGDENHPEVVGINGWCDNKAIISKGINLDFEVPRKVCVVSQTTEKLENWINLITYISKTSKEMAVFNTICAATELRQNSTSELSKKVEAMIVIGGKHSSNTTKLYDISKGNCKNTYFVENAEELKKYIDELKDFNKIGITAGASTPNWIIKEAMELL